MQINWDIVSRIVPPIITLILGKYLDQRLQRRARLVSYLGHASAFNIAGQPPAIVHTHAIVIYNSGREAATNVRVGHLNLPQNINIFPPVAHEVQRQPNGSGEIIIPTLVPSEQITISYLYFPPLLWNGVNVYTKCDEGMATVVQTLHTPVLGPWTRRALRILIFVGLLTLVYFLVQALIWMAARVVS